MASDSVQFISLLKKELTLEFRRSYLLYAVVLYLVTNSYIAYKAFGDINPMIWNALFVLIFLFVGLNAILKSFANRFKSKHLFYYSYYNPTMLFASKVMYNWALMIGLSLLLMLSMSFFSGVFVSDMPLFVLSIVLASLGVSCCFSFIALLSLQSGSNSTVFAILALPLVIPILLLMLKINGSAMRLIIDTSLNKDLLMLGGIDLLYIAISILLFPILWKA